MRKTTHLPAAIAALWLAGTACAGEPTGPPPTAADSIVLVDSVPIPANYGIHDTYVRDGIALVSAWNTGLLLYDVGNGIVGGSPSNPILISAIVTSAQNPSGGASVHNSWWFHNPVTGEARYIFVGEEGPSRGIGVNATGDIHVVDVSDLKHPVEVARYHTPAIDGDSAGTHNFWMDEPHQVLYAAYYNGGMIALDVSGTLSGDLSNRLIAQTRPAGAGQTFFWGVQQADDGSIYALDMLTGLWHFQLTGNSFTTLGGGNNVPERYSSDLWVRGGYAYTGTWGTRGTNSGNVLKIWQTSAGSPVLLDSVVTPGYVTVSDVEVSGDGRLLLVTGEYGTGAGLYLYSLADPAHPALLAHRLVQGGSGLHTGTFADINGRRYVFTARDPASPALLIFDVTGVHP